MDSFAISIDCCPDMVQRLFTIVKENPVSELTINTVKMSKVEQALKAANETRALRIGSGILNEVAGLFKEQFAGRKAVVVADVTTYRVAGERVEKELRNANIELLPSFIFTDSDLYAEYSYVDRLVESLKVHDAIPVAVGSGTINDLTKLASHLVGRRYMCGHCRFHGWIYCIRRFHYCKWR